MEDGRSPVDTPVWRPCGTPPLPSHGHSVSACCLAPQLVYQDWLIACRSSAPHSSADTGTPHSRFAAFSVYPGRPDCPLFSAITGSRVSRSHSLVLVVIPLRLSLCYCCAVAVSSLCGTLPSTTHGGLPPVLSSCPCCQYALFRGSARHTVGLSPFVTLLFFSGFGTA